MTYEKEMDFFFGGCVRAVSACYPLIGRATDSKRTFCPKDRRVGTEISTEKYTETFTESYAIHPYLHSPADDAPARPS